MSICVVVTILRELQLLLYSPLILLKCTNEGHNLAICLILSALRPSRSRKYILKYFSTVLEEACHNYISVKDISQYVVSFFIVLIM